MPLWSKFQAFFDFSRWKHRANTFRRHIKYNTAKSTSEWYFGGFRNAITFKLLIIEKLIWIKLVMPNVVGIYEGCGNLLAVVLVVTSFRLKTYDRPLLFGKTDLSMIFRCKYS